MTIHSLRRLATLALLSTVAALTAGLASNAQAQAPAFREVLEKQNLGLSLKFQEKINFAQVGYALTAIF